MYRKFELRLSDNFIDEKEREGCHQRGEEIYRYHKMKARGCIDKFIGEDGEIDGGALRNAWFGAVSADIFLSHSHEDLEKAVTLAGWLKKEFGLNTFIDSCVWGYSNELLVKLDDRFCRESDGNYHYKKRNITTAHVHAMLTVALSEMIDKTECVMFFNTPNSIVLEKDMQASTSSAWIFEELAFTGTTRIKPPKRLSPYERRDSAVYESYESDRMLHLIRYPVNEYIDEMKKLDDRVLRGWQSAWKELPHYLSDERHALDELYKLLQ